MTNASYGNGGTQSAYSMKDPKVSMKFMGGNSTVLDVSSLAEFHFS